MITIFAPALSLTTAELEATYSKKRKIKESDYQLVKYYRLRAKSRHGSKNLKKIEQVASFYQNLRKKIPSEITLVYKELSQTKKCDFDRFYATQKERFKPYRIDLPVPTPWVCPGILTADVSPVASMSIRILQQSNGIDLFSLQLNQTKPFFCKLIGIPTGSETKSIRNKWHETVFLYKNKFIKNTYHKKAFEVLATSYSLLNID